MTKLYLGVILFFTASANLAFAWPKSAQEYWAGTDMSFAKVAQFFAENCHKNVKNFVACVESLDIAAGYLNHAAVFGTSQLAKSDSSVGILLQTGSINLYEYKSANPQMSFSEIVKNWKLLSEHEMKDYSDIYNNSHPAEVNFSSLLLELQSKILTGSLATAEALIASEVMNKYLAIAEAPHTHIEPLEQYKDEQKPDGLSEIGALVKKLAGKFFVESPLAASPALKAGLQSKDIIESIDGRPTMGQPLDELLRQFRGQENSSVRLGIRRNGNLIPEVTVTRDNLKNVTGENLEDAKVPIRYIRLGNFHEATACDDVEAELKKANSSHAKGIILDLRNNPGGNIIAAVCVASLFVGEKLIVETRDLSDPQNSLPYTGFKKAASSLPMVTLLNANTASSSEIVAGALRDYKRTWVGGECSFGKGSAQTESEWSPSIILWKTNKRFYQPSGTTNQIVGICPQFPLKPVPGATDDDEFSIREGDYYANAFSAIGPKWKDTRKAKVEIMDKCLRSYSSSISTIYDSLLRAGKTPDYQLISAQFLFRCEP